MRRERSYMNVRRAVFVFLMLAGVVIWSFFALFHKRRDSSGASLSSDEGSEQLKMKLLELTRRRRGGSWDFDLHVVVRRRVPTGPDPIHNRRVVTNRRQPGA